MGKKPKGKKEKKKKKENIKRKKEKEKEEGGILRVGWRTLQSLEVFAIVAQG